MSTRSSILALAAMITTLAAAALVPATASAAANTNTSHVAKPVSGPNISNKIQKNLIGHDKITYSPKKLIGGDPNTWSPTKKIGGDPNTWTPHKYPPNNWYKHHHRHHYWWWFARQRYYYVTPEVTTTTAEVSAPAARVTSTAVVSANCNCLTKEYLEDGSVLFKDLCTKEAAVATPDELKARAQGAAPQIR